MSIETPRLVITDFRSDMAKAVHLGSLDEDTLQQAIKVLTGLADGQRLVGIISHVRELKERIEKQIVVTKEKSGGSKARIVDLG